MVRVPLYPTSGEREALAQLGLKYRRGLMDARLATANLEHAEAFRRRCEIIWIFRGLSDQYRHHPFGQNTKNEVLRRLAKIGISCSERTLSRDYAAVGGARALRNVKLFAPGEDRSSPGPISRESGT